MVMAECSGDVVDIRATPEELARQVGALL